MPFPSQVSLQLACGSFLLNQAFADAANIPMDKLKWTSPFSSHRAALSPMSHGSPSRKDTTLPAVTCHLLAPEDDAHTQVNGFGEDVSQQTRIRHLSSSALDSPPRSTKMDNELSLPVLSTRRFSSPDSVQDSSSSSVHTDSGLGSESDGAEVQLWMESIEEQRKSHPESMIWATAVALAWMENHSAAYFTEWELLASKADRWLCKQRIPEGRTLATVKSAAQQLFVLLRHWDENLQFNVLCYNPSSV